MTEPALHVSQAFEVIEPLPRAERALLQHVLMQALNKPGLLTDALPQRLLNLIGLVRALPPDMLGLLAIALGDLRYLEHFLAGGEPSDFI